eukprot:s3136_g2.t1
MIGKTEEEPGRKWKRCEFAVGNRDAIVPPDLCGMARRVLCYFATPNMTVEFTPAAKNLFLAFSTCFTAKAGMLRDAGEDACAPRAATGAWHLAILAAANMIFELAIGEARLYEYHPTLHHVPLCFCARPASQVDHELVAQRGLRVEERHIHRSFDQVKLCHDLIGIWSRGTYAPIVAPPIADPMTEALSSAARLDEALGGQRLPVSQFEPFEPSQPVMDGDVEEYEELLSQKDAPRLDEGYGENGASVQDPQHGPVKWSDRESWLVLVAEIMMRTIGRAEPVIFGRVVCDTCSKKTKDEATGKYSRVSLKIGHWQAVMEAGLRQWPIGEYISNAADRKGPRVRLYLPDPSDRRSVAQFHNKLMNLCNLTFASVSQKMVAVASKAPRRKEQKPQDSLEQAAKEEVEEGRRSPAPEDVPAEPAPKRRKRLRPLRSASSPSRAREAPEGAAGPSQPRAVAAPGPCGWCGFPLSRKCRVAASILDAGGWHVADHQIRRCRNRDCDRFGKEIGYNYVVEKRGGSMILEWEGDLPMKYFFISRNCGFTTAYLRQLSRRVAFQHVSFENEARVHELEAMAQGQQQIVPYKAKQKIFRAWVLWRLVSCQQFAQSMLRGAT